MSARPNQKKIHCLLEKLPSLCLKYLGVEAKGSVLGQGWCSLLPLGFQGSCLLQDAPLGPDACSFILAGAARVAHEAYIAISPKQLLRFGQVR